MRTILIATLALFFLSACGSNVTTTKPWDKADTALIVVLGEKENENDEIQICPLSVVSVDQSCPGGPSVQSNKACRKPDKFVFWKLATTDADYEIAEITEKAGSPKGFKTQGQPCKWFDGSKQQYYRCKLKEAADLPDQTEIEYLVTVKNTATGDQCTLDPVIIIHY
jgi:hypothetical protein